MTVHAEIEYIRKDGVKVHSDVCPPECSEGSLKDLDYREYLHNVLDEWMDASKGTGGFYIKQEGYTFDEIL